MRRLLGTVLACVSACVVTAMAPPSAPAHPRPAFELGWAETVVDTAQSFRGLDAVDRDTAWVSGGNLEAGGPAAVYRTTDGGASWQDVSPAGTDGLMFRDVEVLGPRAAVVLAIGPGQASRIYRTSDGGATWRETFRNQEEAAFYNCVDFYPGGRHGLAVSDPVDGKFRILRTLDGGRTWSVLPDDGMPDSSGEYNFSASGDCLVIEGGDAWFGSGGADSRVFRSTDRGLTWTAGDSAIPAGEAAGVFGLAFRTPRHGVAVGGDFAAPADGTDATSTTHGADVWTSGGDLRHLGEDASWLRQNLVVVGESGQTGGSSISRDGGRTWKQFSEVGYHTLDCTPDGSCWAAGGGGRVGLLRH